MTLEFQISIVECLKDCNLEHESCTVGNVQFDSVVVNYNYKMFARLGSGFPLGSTNLLFIIKLFAYSFLTFGSVRSLLHFSTRIFYLSLGIKPWVSPMTILCLIQLPIIFSFLTTKDVMIPFSIPLFLNRKNRKLLMFSNLFNTRATNFAIKQRI